MELEMEKLIEKKQEEMNVANGEEVLSKAFATRVARMQQKRKVH